MKPYDESRTQPAERPTGPFYAQDLAAAVDPAVTLRSD